MPNRSRGRGRDMLQVVSKYMVAICGLLACATAASAQGAPVQQPYQQQQYQPPSSNQPGSNQAASNPVCGRLQAQLASVDQGSADPARADQIKRADDAIAKQQADLDHAVAQAHKAGCAGEGFFALFSALSPQCGPITSSIQQMRGNLDRMMSDQQKLKGGGSDAEDGQRRALIGALAQNNCGAQYASAASSSGPAGFFDAFAAPQSEPGLT